MKPKQRIMEFIQDAYKNEAGKKPAGERSPSGEDHLLDLQQCFEGMSTGTARIVIEEEIDDQIAEDYEIQDLQNKGRYYAARIVGADGSPIKRLLVDKQTGHVQFAGR